ncbi:hypothetical protein [Treponema saccharophilum]|uniref:hypothetical protein n=1 Tax=Treponema saccharophilum TaxID=165 RepID=UPI0038705FE6
MKKIFKTISALALLAFAGSAAFAATGRGDQATRSGGVEGENASTKNAVTVQLGLPTVQEISITVTKGNFVPTVNSFRFEENPAGVKITSVTRDTASANTYNAKFTLTSVRGNLKFWLVDNDANYVPITFNGTTGKVATMEVCEPMSDGIPQRYEPPTPSSAETKQAKNAGYEDGFKTAAGEKESAYKSRASAKSKELGYTSELVSDYMEGVKTGRLNKAEANGYKICYDEYTKLKKEAAAAKKKVTPKINYTKLAQNSGYTDSAEIERFKKGGEKGVKAAQDGKSAVVPKFSNPYK